MEQIVTPFVLVSRTKSGPTLLWEQAEGVTAMATFNPQTFLNQIPNGKTMLKSPKKQVLFSQGDKTDAVFYVQAGKVKLTTVSSHGKEAVIVILEPGSFFGEGGLAGQLVHLATATVTEDARIVRIDKQTMLRLLKEDRTFSALFLTYMLARNVRIQEDLVDQLFNSSEKRLARALLLMAHFGKEGKREEVIAKISQETLAEMIGTTRSRVSFFMTRFKKMGLIHYDDGLHVHSSLLNVVLHD
jgi:CRP/FNR family transcriptional regulator, cyclic AMP receptor protein